MPGVCENGACDNMMGSHRCICNPGYEVDASGKKCQDINECQDELICSGGQCRNSPGSYQVITEHLSQRGGLSNYLNHSNAMILAARSKLNYNASQCLFVSLQLTVISRSAVLARIAKIG